MKHYHGPLKICEIQPFWHFGAIILDTFGAPCDGRAWLPLFANFLRVRGPCLQSFPRHQNLCKTMNDKDFGLKNHVEWVLRCLGFGKQYSGDKTTLRYLRTSMMPLGSRFTCFGAFVVRFRARLP